MKEINRHTLQQAIRQLPEYAPPPQIWERVEQGLLVADQEEQISEVISELHQYDPPAFLWEKIEEALEIPKQEKIGRVIPLGVRRFMAYAAVAAGIIVSFFMIRNNQPVEQISYAEEVVNEATFVNDWNADEEDFEVVLAALEESEYLTQIPEIQQLKFELEELNDAKMEVESMMEQYGTDEKLVGNIREIELERTDIIKKLAAFI
ncbi:MAG: hypothetical protein KDC85_15075 [Saprospiraceae bacterium]|nr:hypothetical protein [Saprospiraceae bacterium]MCB9323077.1 hypothetical protein [Lewinellaceae bacterium]